MANGHGGRRAGAGRASRAEILGLPMLIEDVMGEDGKRELIQKIFDQARAGSFPHQQLILAYAYGKPSDHVDITSKGEKLQNKEIIFRNYADSGV